MSSPEDADFFDKYHKLYGANEQLKVKYNALEEEFTRFKTQSRKTQAQAAALTGGAISTNDKMLNKDDEERLMSLYSENTKLKSHIKQLKEKLKATTEALDKKTRETGMLRSRLKSASNSTLPKIPPVSRSQEIDIQYTNPVKKAAGGIPSISSKENDSANSMMDHQGLVEVARKYKTRLVAAEGELDKLRNEMMRMKSSNSHTNAAMSFSHAQDEAGVRDANFKLQQLQTQYDLSQQQRVSTMQYQKALETEKDEYVGKVKELRKALQELRYEKEQADIKADRVEELETLNSELRRGNRGLEDKIASLCESPFLAEAMGQHESRMRVEDYAKEREDNLAKVSHLQEAVRTHHSALVSLRQETLKLREDKERAETMLAEANLSRNEVERGSNFVKDKLRLFVDDEAIDDDMLMKALTIVKKKTDAQVKLPFIEDPDDDGTELTLPLAQRKLEESESRCLSYVEEISKLNNMLQLMDGINKHLEEERELTTTKRNQDKAFYEAQVTELRGTADRRKDEIEKLKARLRQFIYDPTTAPTKKGEREMVDKKSRNKGSKVANSHALAADADHEAALRRDLVDACGEEGLSPDVNLMEVWIRSATINGDFVPSSSSSFVVCDFFDYESQATIMREGTSPVWDHAASYKLTIDDFLLYHVATDVLTIELNASTQGNFDMIAFCKVPLNGLLRAKPHIALVNQPMISPKGEVVAHINVELRLAISVSELYQLYLERNPIKKKAIQNKVKELAIDSTSVVSKAQIATNEIASAKRIDESRLYNDLEVAILKAEGLPSIDGIPPTAYVHLQFLAHPDQLTHPIKATTDPVFNTRFNFFTITNETNILLLRRNKMLLTVVDYNGEEKEGEGLIGEVQINMKQIAEGESVTDTYNITDLDGNAKGTLTVGIRWKYVFKEEADIGPRGLTAVEVEALISEFSARDIGAGVVDYKEFCRFVDPEPTVARLLNRLRNHAERVADKERRGPSEVFLLLFGDSHAIDEPSFVGKIEQLQLEGVQSNECSKLFQYLDSDEDGFITLGQFLKKLNLDDSGNIPAGLHRKLQERSKDYQARGRFLSDLFRDSYVGSHGVVTTLDFKNSLRSMGFELVDDVELNDNNAHNFTHMGTNKALLENGAGRGDMSLNDTADDEILTSKGHAHLDAYANERKEFEDRSRAAQEGREKAGSMHDSAVYERSEAPIHGADPHLSYSTRGDSKTMPNDDLRESAAALQEVIASNRKMVTASLASATSAPAPEPTFASDGSRKSFRSIPGIIAAEANIARYMNKIRGIKPEPNLRQGFAPLDRANKGHVRRDQFAFAMDKADDDVTILDPATDLLACMDYFDVSEHKDGSKIAYEHFIRFFADKPLTPLQQVVDIQSLVLSPDAVSMMRVHDHMGDGQIKKTDLMSCLKELGVGIAAGNMSEMLGLFQTKDEGFVNYGNFVEYIHENDLSLQMLAVGRAIYDIAIRTKGNPDAPSITDVTVQPLFNKIDERHRGKFGKEELGRFLEGQELSTSDEVNAALVSQMSIKGRAEANLTTFTSWLKRVPMLTDSDPAYVTPSLKEMRTKAQKYMTAVDRASASFHGSVSRESVSAFYIKFDYAGDRGLIDRELFAHATRSSGFPFTSSEIRCLAAEFASRETQGEVNYKGFLSWALPDSNLDSLYDSEAGRHKGGKNQPHGHSTSALIRLLETKAHDGVDLLQVFARYDKMQKRRITADEFCAAFADLGLSTVTRNEALAVADSYSAAVDNFIIYGKVASAINARLDDVAGALDIDVPDMIKAALQRTKTDFQRLKDVFEHYDNKKNDKVYEEDLETIFEEGCGTKQVLRRAEINSIADKYGVSGGNRYTLINYRPLLADVEALIGRRKPNSVLPDELSIRVRDMFHTLINRGIDYRAEFDKYDSEKRTGTISQAHFRELLNERFKCNLSQRNLSDLEAAYRYNEDVRRVNYAKLIYELSPLFFSNKRIMDDESKVIVEALRNKIRRRCDYRMVNELRKPFLHFVRREHASTVSVDDLALGMRDLQMRVAGDQVQAVFDLINSGETSEFTYTDFRVFVRDPCNKDVTFKLRKMMDQKRVSRDELVNAMRDQDSNKSGLISLSQFEKAIRWCKLDISEDDANRLMLRFDDDEEKQRFDIDKFSRFLQGLPFTRPAGTKEGSATSGMEGDDPIESKGWNDLRRRIIDKLAAGDTPSQVFGYFHSQDSRTLDAANLLAGSKQIGAPLTKAETNALMRRMTQLSNGPVDLRAFFEGFKVNTNEDFSATYRDRKRRDNEDDTFGGGRSNRYGDDDRYRYERRTSPRDDADDLEGTYEHLREQLERHRTVVDGTKASSLLQRALSRACTDRGTCTQHELKKAISDILHLEINPRSLQKWFNTLDPDLTDYVSVSELVKSVYPRSAMEAAPDDREKARSGRDIAAGVFKQRTDLRDKLVEFLSTSDDVDDLEATFKKADRDHSEQLERGKFAECLKAYGYRLSVADERDVVDSLGEGASAIDYMDFLHAIRLELKADQVADDVLIRLQKKISRDMKHGHSLLDEFEKMDKDGSGELDVDELSAAFESFGIPLEREEARRLVDKFSVSGTAVRYKDFIRAVAPNNFTAGDMVDAILDKLRRTLEQRLRSSDNPAGELKRAFADIDHNNSGTVSKIEFRDTMDSLGVEVGKEEVDIIFKRYDEDFNGAIDYDEFLKMVGYSGKPDGPPKRGNSRVDERDFKAVLIRVREAFEYHLGSDASNPRRVKEAFTEIDRNGDNHVSIREFEDAVRILKVR
jgi:Ca2+-binding EF-hand superfamily protein